MLPFHKGCRSLSFDAGREDEADALTSPRYMSVVPRYLPGKALSQFTDIDRSESTGELSFIQLTSAGEVTLEYETFTLLPILLSRYLNFDLTATSSPK